MKYKCVEKYIIDDTVIMKPGDFITIEGDRVYNITTGLDYKDIPNSVRKYLEVITDDPSTNYPVKSNSDKFKEITDEMYDLFIKKNHDYGNSFEESLNEEGLAASRIRIGDKWRRYITLSRGEKAKVNDESIRDTLIDMAVYSIMTLMWLK